MLTLLTYLLAAAAGAVIAGFAMSRRGAQVQRFSRMFAALGDTNEAIMRAASPQDLYQRVCEAAVHGGRLIAASICVPGEDSADAQIAAAAGVSAEKLRQVHLSIDSTTAEGRGLIGTAFRTQAPCISNDFLSDTRTAYWHNVANQAGVASAAAVPLIQHGRTVGVLLLYSAEKHIFDEEIVQLLMHMVRNVVFALDNFKREAERNATEDELHASDARLKRAQRGANDGLWELDVATREMWVSPRFAEMFGFDHQEFLGTSQKFFEVVHAEDVA